MLYSSFTDQNVADALNQVADEARGVIQQYGKGVNDVIDAWFKEGSGIGSDLASLFGQDAAYYADPNAPWNQAPVTSPGPVAPGQPYQSVYGVTIGGTGGGGPSVSAISTPAKKKAPNLKKAS
jgi:hypothetical protein